MRRRASISIMAAVGLLGLGLAAAGGLLVWHMRFRQPPPVNGELPFATVERARSPGALSQFFPRAAPGLLVLTSSQDFPSVAVSSKQSAVGSKQKAVGRRQAAVGTRSEQVAAFRRWGAVG